MDQQNVLHCYKYDVEEGEWEDVDLQPSEDAEPLIVHASGHISGATISTGQIVFFEDANCQIRGVQVDGEGKWSYLSQDSISFKPGSPHALIHSDDGNLHLLYIHEDNSLHRLSGTPENGDWLGAISLSFPPCLTNLRQTLLCLTHALRKPMSPTFWLFLAMTSLFTCVFCSPPGS